MGFYTGIYRKKPFYKKWWFWTIIIVLIIYFGFSRNSYTKQGSETADNSYPSVSDKATIPDLEKYPSASDKATIPDLEMIEDSVLNNGITPCIAGTVKNNTDKKYLYVQVEFDLYDANGAEIGNALANTSNLEPNGTWNFEAEVLGDFSTYKLKKITGFGLPATLSKLLEKWS